MAGLVLFLWVTFWRRRVGSMIARKSSQTYLLGVYNSIRSFHNYELVRPCVNPTVVGLTGSHSDGTRRNRLNDSVLLGA